MKTLFVFCFIIGVLCLAWAFLVEPKMLVVQKYKISVPKLKGLKVVFMSDFHVGPNDEERLKKIVKKANEQNADLVLLGGDFVNGHKGNHSLPIEIIAKNLGELKAQLGIVSVLGNHDWFVFGEKISAELAKNNITVLRDENKALSFNGLKFHVAGLEDPVTQRFNIEKALDGVKNPVILLTHTPDVYPQISNAVDITLAGHTHGGQVKVPFFGAILVPSKFGRRYAEGFFNEDNKKMIVTKGLGTSLLPMRFNCPPEIVVIDFE